MTSILPAHLSELERDLEQSVARIADVEIPISTLWDPWQCPLEVLPYLAWALSVDQWRSNWPETVKRRVVAASLPLHRIKGTRPAVEQALEALGITTELTEWFETEPPLERGTFSLIAWANENLTPGEVGFLNQSLYEQVRTEVENAKNARSHFTFKVGARFDPVTVGAAAGAMAPGALARRDAGAVQDPLVSAFGLGVGMAGQSASLTRRDAGVVHDPLVSGSGITLGMGGRGAALTRQVGRPEIDARLRVAPLLVAGMCRAAAVTRRTMATALDASLPESVAYAAVPAPTLFAASSWRAFAISYHTMESTT